MKRTFVAVALAVIFVLALAAPAFAMTHTATYEMDGVINFMKQAGHKCNTGAEFKQVIDGSGKMDKVMTVTMAKYKLTISDTNDWVAGATPLTVTSVWDLCTPPKYTYDGYDGYSDEIVTAPVHPLAMYNFFNIPATFGGQDGFKTTANGITVEALADHFGWDALTSQIWAVQVKADPGFSGNLHQKGEAAYGPYWGTGEETLPAWDYDDKWGDNKGTWRWEADKDGYLSRGIGGTFVGDYFNMEQFARTSQGTLKRYIDISSPWSGAYLHQDMSVVGMSEVREGFMMPNLPKGDDIPGNWWELF